MEVVELVVDVVETLVDVRLDVLVVVLEDVDDVELLVVVALPSNVLAFATLEYGATSPFRPNARTR